MKDMAPPNEAVAKIVAKSSLSAKQGINGWGGGGEKKNSGTPITFRT